MSHLENIVSFAHEGTRISALVPGSWAVSEVTPRHVRFFAPAHPDHEDHRSTFSISLGEPEGFAPDEYEDFCDASLARLSEGLPGFALRRVERFTLSSFVDIHAVWYHSRAESGLEFAMLQALGLLDRYNVYLINAATLTPLADVYLPAFDEILRSLRVLPVR